MVRRVRGEERAEGSRGGAEERHYCGGGGCGGEEEFFFVEKREMLSRPSLSLQNHTCIAHHLGSHFGAQGAQCCPCSMPRWTWSPQLPWRTNFTKKPFTESRLPMVFLN